MTARDAFGLPLAFVRPHRGIPLRGPKYKRGRMTRQPMGEEEVAGSRNARSSAL